MSATGCSSSYQEAVTSVEMMGREVRSKAHWEEDGKVIWLGDRIEVFFREAFSCSVSFWRARELKIFVFLGLSIGRLHQEQPEVRRKSQTSAAREAPGFDEESHGRDSNRDRRRPGLPRLAHRGRHRLARAALVQNPRRSKGGRFLEKYYNADALITLNCGEH